MTQRDNGQINVVKVGDSGLPCEGSVYSKDGTFEIGCLIRIDANGTWPLFEITGKDGDTLIVKPCHRLDPSR